MARKTLLSGSAQGAVAESDDDKEKMEAAPADPAETDEEDAPPAKGKAKSKSKAEDMPPEDDTEPEEPKAAAAVSEDRAIVKACTAAGQAHLADGFLDAGLSLAQVQHRLQDAPAIREAVATAHRLSGGAITKDRAESFIQAGTPVQAVKAELWDDLVRMEAPEIRTQRADKAPERMDGNGASADALWDAAFARLGITEQNKAS